MPSFFASRLQDGAVGDEPLNDIEAQKRFDGGAEGLAAAFIFGQDPDFLGIEEEKLRDVEREEVFDQLRPIIRQPRVGQPVLQHPQVFAQPAF